MTGTAHILDRLRHGPATAAELYGLHCIVHSRVAELRKQGHVITCTHTPGMSGPGAYVYRLDGSLGEEARQGMTASELVLRPGTFDCDRKSCGASSPSDSLTHRGGGATLATGTSSGDRMLSIP